MRVTVTNEQTGTLQQIETGENGNYQFPALESGTYTLKIEAAGFSTHTSSGLSLRAGEEQHEDKTLELGASIETMTMGVMAISPSDPLVIAVMQDDLAKVKELIATGADVNVVDNGVGTTPLSQAMENGNPEIVATLLRAGADVNAKNRRGMTPLMYVGEKTTEEMLSDLITAGARVNRHDEDGETALMYAARIENKIAVQALLAAGAKVNAKNKTGQTALMLAAENGLVENARALINAGADINRRDKDGATALKIARDNEHTDVADLLVAFAAVEENEEEPQ